MQLSPNVVQRKSEEKESVRTGSILMKHGREIKMCLPGNNFNTKILIPDTDHQYLFKKKTAF